MYVVHQQQSIYIADFWNNRIVKWKLGEKKDKLLQKAMVKEIESIVWLILLM